MKAWTRRESVSQSGEGEGEGEGGWVCHVRGESVIHARPEQLEAAIERAGQAGSGQ